MAQKQIRIGSFGPFIYDDVTEDALKTDGNIQANNIVTDGLTSNVRLVVSDANKQLAEVNDLTPYIAGNGIDVGNDGDGTVTLSLTLPNIARAAITSVDSPYTAAVSALENIVIADSSSGAITVNLPAVSSWANQIIVVKKIDASNTVTIDGDGIETIDGSATLALTVQYESARLFSDGAVVHVL